MKLNKFKLNFAGICALALTLITLDCVIGTNIDSINNYFQGSRFDSSDFKDIATKIQRISPIDRRRRGSIIKEQRQLSSLKNEFR